MVLLFRHRRLSSHREAHAHPQHSRHKLPAVTVILSRGNASTFHCTGPLVDYPLRHDYGSASDRAFRPSRKGGRTERLRVINPKNHPTESRERAARPRAPSA
eukprot:4599466-Amphidinium_carterae.2